MQSSRIANIIVAKLALTVIPPDKVAEIQAVDVVAKLRCPLNPIAKVQIDRLMLRIGSRSIERLPI
jgi:hypothetical protein